LKMVDTRIIWLDFTAGNRHFVLCHIKGRYPITSGQKFDFYAVNSQAKHYK